MKSKLLLLFTLSAFTSISTAYAQGEMDAYKLSKNELRGTARSVSMGGAFGALGGDISGVSINPAGIGVYTKSEIVTSLNFQNTKMESDFLGYKEDKSKFNVNFDNLGFVAAFPIFNDDIPFVNFGFSYNRLKSFDRKYSTQGEGFNSLTDYIAFRTGNTPSRDLKTGGANDPWENNDWLSVLGYNSSLLHELGAGGYMSSMNGLSEETIPGETILPYNRLYVREKGSVNSYDFNVGTTFVDMISAGISIGLTDIDYRLYSSFLEDFDDGFGAGGGYDLVNSLKTEGTGWQIKLGTILKPIEELRIGIAYHSPTWYRMTDFYTADIYHDLTDLKGGDNHIPGSYTAGNVRSPEGAFDYRLRTPDKWTFSMAGIIANKAILSADVELTNYKNMKLFDDDGNTLYGEYNPNLVIKDDFRMSTTLRLGAEYRITSQFSGRVGYQWVQSPLQKEFKNNESEVMLMGTIPHYVLEGNTNHFTYGLGYRFTPNFYLDLAFVMTSQKDDLYLFPNVYEDGFDIAPDKIPLKTNQFRGLLTFGHRF